MQRIANGTQVSSMPTPAAPIGTPGYGTNGDTGAGLLGTRFGADEFNRIQEELMSFLTAAGITPDGGNNAQVLAAIRQLFAPHMQVFTATGSFTVPAGVTRIKVRLWGAGGGGGGGGSPTGGGGGGGYAEGVYTVTPGSGHTATVGAGGTLGVAGGTTSLGALLSATGGGGGGLSSAGAGGVGTGGQLNLTGQSGGLGIGVGSDLAGGVGGGTFGTPPATSPWIGGGNQAGSYPGGGASGFAAAGASQPGADGLIVVEW